MGRLLLLLPLAGCATLEKHEIYPYFEVGLSAPIESKTDWWIHPDNPNQCEPPWFDAEVGLEKEGWALGVYHYSTVLCGGHNDKPEVYWNGIRGSKRFGGVPR